MQKKILDILFPPYRPFYIDPVDTSNFIQPRLSLYQRLRCIYNRYRGPEEDVIIVDINE